MRHRLLGLVIIILGFGLALVALRGGFSTYQRTRALWSFVLAPQPQEVQGIITEALIEPRRETIPPFPLTAYVIRYAFPAPPLGTMLNGEQIVTRAQYERLGEQGDLVTVVFDPLTPERNAVVPWLNFPAHASIWLVITFLAAWGAVGALTVGTGLAFSRNRVRATSRKE